MDSNEASGYSHCITAPGDIMSSRSHQAMPSIGCHDKSCCPMHPTMPHILIALLLVVIVVVVLPDFRRVRGVPLFVDLLYCRAYLFFQAEGLFSLAPLLYT